MSVAADAGNSALPSGEPWPILNGKPVPLVAPLDLGDGTYGHSASNVFVRASAVREKAKVIREAQTWCLSHGKTLRLISLRTNEDADRELAPASRGSVTVNVAAAAGECATAAAGPRRSRVFAESRFTCVAPGS